MADFNKIIAWVLYQEDDHREPGKIVNLNDGGGQTRLGITSTWHSKDVPSDFFTTMAFKDAVAAAKTVYHNLYWIPLSGDVLDEQIAAPLMSFAINDTPRVATKTLQRVLGISTTGFLRPITLQELSGKDPLIVAKMFRAEWENFYQQDVALNPSKAKFLQEWISRVNFSYPNPITDMYL